MNGWPIRSGGIPAMLLLLASCAPPAVEGPAPADGDAWVESALAGLSPRERVAQLVMPWLTGGYMPEGSEEHRRLLDLVATQKVGGIIVSVGAPLELAAKVNELQAAAPLPLLVAADMEHGPGQRLDGGVHAAYGIDIGRGTQFPPVMGIAATGDTALAYAMGRITALEGRAAGVHMTFAPVVDVNNNPDNPIINTRSYGEDPAAVARFAAAHVRGLQEHGMLATAKHFPGHGDTHIDSHIELPVITAQRGRVDAVELVPFRAAVEAGVAAVMTAHIAFPALTGDSVPATLSPALSTTLLREELGFAGLLVTDALVMGGIVGGYGGAEAAVLAVEAGADILLMPGDAAEAIDAVAAAVQSGRISPERIDRSVRRILQVKAGLGLDRHRTVDLDELADVVGIPEHRAVAEEAARRSITVAMDRDALLPLPRNARVLSIVYSDDPAAARTGAVLQRELAERVPHLEPVLVDPRTLPAVLDSLEALAAGADLVLLSPFVRVRAGQERLDLPPELSALLGRLTEAGRAVVAASFGNPYVLRSLPGVGTYVLAWGQEDVVQAAAARALLGEAAVTGRLPISISPELPAGTGLTLEAAVERVSAARRVLLVAVPPAEMGMSGSGLARVDSIVEAAVRAGVTPGAALAVGRRGKLVRLQGYGRLDRAPDAPPATDSTLWDLASLTKVVGTTTALMLLVDAGRLELDVPLHRYLPEWPASGQKAGVTVRHLLRHDAGLPAFGPLFRRARGPDEYLRAIADLPLEYAPGTKTVYSDFGVILLGILAERLAGMPLDAYLERRVFHPLGMADTRFSPLQLAGRERGLGPWGLGAPAPRATTGPTAPATNGSEAANDAVAAEVAALLRLVRRDSALAALYARTAPTERDRHYRRTHVRALVHDENAYALGGVAGHAGLFSSARDLAVFATLLLDGGRFGPRRVLREETVRLFTARQGDGSSRALGWDTPAPRSSAGSFFSEKSFGHTGFTGTSLWIDPERDVFVVLLTNRVNPTRRSRGIAELRRSVHDAVQQAITDVPVSPRPGAEAR